MPRLNMNNQIKNHHEQLAPVHHGCCQLEFSMIRILEFRLTATVEDIATILESPAEFLQFLQPLSPCYPRYYYSLLLITSLSPPRSTSRVHQCYLDETSQLPKELRICSCCAINKPCFQFSTATVPGTIVPFYHRMIREGAFVSSCVCWDQTWQSGLSPHLETAATATQLQRLS